MGKNFKKQPQDRQRSFPTRLFFCLIVYLISPAASTDQQEFQDENAIDYDWLLAHPDAPSLLWSNSSVELSDDGIDWIANFECAFQSDTIPLLSWHYKGQRIDFRHDDTENRVWEERMESDNVSVSFMRIANFSSDDTDTPLDKYTCVAVNAFGFEGGNLWPHALPIIEVNDVTDPIQPGTETSITCVGYHKAKLFWKLPGNSERHSDATFNSDSLATRGATSTLTITVVEEDNGAPYRCCIASDDPRSVRDPDCSEVSLDVASDPRLMSYESCTAGSAPCNLSCTFTGSPSSDQITWQSCSTDDSSQCSDVTADSSVVSSGSWAQTTLSLQDDVTVANYVCSCQDVNTKAQASYTFSITGTQIAPRFLSSDFNVEGWRTNPEVADKVTYTCIFSANVNDVIITWLKDELQGSNGTVTIEHDGDRIRITNTDDGLSLTTELSIAQYDSADYAFTYTCVASDPQNGVPVAIGPKMAAHVWEDFVSISASDHIVEELSWAEVTCASASFPPPRLEFTLVAEFELDYREHSEEPQNGMSTSVVEFLARFLSDYVIVRCESANYLSLNVTVATNSTPIATIHDAGVVSFATCDLEKFTSEGSCDLTSTVQHDPTAREKDYKWAYTAERSFSNESLVYIIDDSGDYGRVDVTPFRTNYTLRLSNYSAGVYHCVVEYYDPLYEYLDDVVDMDFKIHWLWPGRDLGSPCNTSSQCLAYNAQCEEQECRCVTPNYIPITTYEMASACLPAAGPDDQCYVNAQCSAVAKNYNCSALARCRCDGLLKQEDNQTHCLIPVSVSQNCTYMEECQLNDLNSECLDQVCVCFPNTTYRSFDGKCNPDTSGLSTGAIAGIVIACVCIVGVVVYFLFSCRKKPTKKKEYYRPPSGKEESIMWGMDSESSRTGSNSSSKKSFSVEASPGSEETDQAATPDGGGGGAESTSADLIEIDSLSESVNSTWM